jgi:pimeloyl-ACP methyl ester carboxylesterase
VYVHEAGPGAAPTIVFVHGGASAGWMWQPQLERFGDYHCLVPDLPGHGQSLHAGPFGIHRSAELVAELIRTRAHGGKAHVVGLSAGAQVTVALLALAPDLVDHAVASSALVRPMAIARLVTPRLVALAYRWTVRPFRDRDWWIRLNMKHAAGIPPAYYPQFRQAFRELTEPTFTNVLVENQRFRLPPGLERVQVPTLVVVGAREPAALRQSAQDLAAAIPGARACAVWHVRGMSAAAEHSWNLTTPDLFTDTVRAWITDQQVPAPLRTLAPGRV